MARNNRVIRAIAGVTLAFISTLAADTELLTLNYNPFTRPDILKKKPPPGPRNVTPASLQPENIELELTATMVSENAPMVIVNGELLSLGEKIGKLKLIAVMEGKAIFSHHQKRYSFTIDGLDLK